MLIFFLFIFCCCFVIGFCLFIILILSPFRPISNYTKYYKILQVKMFQPFIYKILGEDIAVLRNSFPSLPYMHIYFSVGELSSNLSVNCLQFCR